MNVLINHVFNVFKAKFGRNLGRFKRDRNIITSF